MKIFSWNVNGLRSVINKGALNAFLEKEDPDIFCLQEIKAKPEQVLLDLPDYEEFYNPAVRPGYSGTATFVKKNLTVQNNHGARKCAGLEQLDSLLDEGRILTLEFPNFYLVNVYTPNSKPDLSRLKTRENLWDPAFLHYLKQLEQQKPIVACGDFNAAHTEQDLARPKNNTKNAGFTPEERQGVTNILNAGFIDTFRELNPNTQRYTWWSHWGHARENNVGWRIDYFFISNSLLPYLKNAEIYENITGSDHCPISITLKMPLEAPESPASAPLATTPSPTPLNQKDA